MYESFFGLADRPFAAAPTSKRYFPATAIESARQSLGRCIEREEGIGLVIGPAGTGKSLLCQSLADQFRTRLIVALLTCGRQCTGRVMLQTILFELGLPYRGLEDGELRLSLINHLAGGEPHRGALLLVVDEAHTLPLRLLEEVRLITNLVHNGHSRVRLILAGGPSLEERLASPKLASFNQRISARSYLQSLVYDETLAYVRHAIAGAGGNADRIFTNEALTAVHRATDGIPRLINQLCDHALLLASAGGLSQLGPAAIEETWADLQQLPTPWNAAPGALAQSADIIEFGALDETPPLAMPRDSVKSPRLRTVPLDDESLMFAGEPADRIERIEEQLESIDSQLLPVAKFVPEVELMFESTENPFGESFSDEEPVVDRFASMGGDLISRAQLVHNTESEELSATLKPYARPQTANAAPVENRIESVAPEMAEESIVEPSWAESLLKPPFELPPAPAQLSAEVQPAEAPAETEGSPAAAEEFETSIVDVGDAWSEIPTLRWEDAQHAAILNPADDPVLPEAAFHSAADAEPERPTIPMPAIAPQTTSRETNDERGRLPSESAPPVAAKLVAQLGEKMPAAITPTAPAEVTDEDLDLIIVEDDPAPPPPTRPNPPPPKVRRREFSQLFAQLRRG